MHKPLALACLLFMLFGVLPGCDRSDETPEAARSAAASDSANAPPGEASPYQYMAVCTSKEAHEGNEYVLTKWLDSKYKAGVYGREHSRKRKGHEVIYKERVKP